MEWTLLTLQVLEFLKEIGGSWGMAIVLLTIIVRLALVPLSISQQRSMKKMQELGPRLKQLQNKYKSEPQKLQQKMMEFYKENNFNPIGGCLPLLLQMPVFILLYTSLISVTFIQLAGNSSFLFIHRLDATLQSYAGPGEDGTFNVKEKDKFITGKYRTEVVIDGKTIENCKIDDDKNALKHIPEKIEPGKKLIFTLEPDKIKLPDGKKGTDEIESANVPVLNEGSKELEHLKFKYDPKQKLLVSSIKTVPATGKFNIDAIILLLLFGVTMYGSQKLMTGMSSSAAMDPQQKAMQESMGKIMPFMIMAIFVIVPIPAGVLLYMVVSNIFQVGQTFAINKYLDYQTEKGKPAIATSIDSEPEEEPTTNNYSIIDVKGERINEPEYQSRKARKKKSRGKRK